jgi:hypothetical protein
MKTKQEGARVTINMPIDLKACLEQMAELHWISVNAAAIRVMRSGMQAEQQRA